MSMSWGQLSGRLVMNSIEKRIPLIGEFELTPRCNLHCKMCYICRNSTDTDAIARERTAKEWVQLALDARDMGMLFILLTGGEVFLRKDFHTIYDEISMMGFNVSMYTNGTLITPRIASWLGNRPPSQIEITLYGASPETYNRVCGDSSGFERAIRGIELLLAQGINVQLRTTVVQGNVHDFERLADIAGNYGLPLGIVNYVSPRREGNYSSPEAERLSPKDLAEFEEKVRLYYLHKQTEMQSFNQLNPPQNIQINQLSEKNSKKLSNDKSKELSKQPSDKLYSYYLVEDTNHNQLNETNDFANLNTTEIFPCTSGKNSFWMTWDGRMVPCSMMNKPETNPFEYGFKNAWQKLGEECNKVPSCKTCSKCSNNDYCNACPAALMNETGSYTQPSLYLCQLAQERRNNDNELIVSGDGR